MTAAARESETSDPCESDTDAWLVGTNINPNTLLATDYLHYFNEVVIMIEKLPDMPDCREDVVAWRPKTYQQHFADSMFSEKELAIEAYYFAPSTLRNHFETVVQQADWLVELSVKRLVTAMDAGDDELLRMLANRASRDLKRLVEVAGAIIIGSTSAINQAEIDDMFAY